MNILWILAAIIFVVQGIKTVVHYTAAQIPPSPGSIAAFILIPSLAICFLIIACELIVKRLEHNRRNIQPYVIISATVLICAVLLIIHYYTTVFFIAYALPIFFSLVYNKKRVLLYAFLSSFCVFTAVYTAYYSYAELPEIIFNIAMLCAAYPVAVTVMKRLEEAERARIDAERSAYEAETAKVRAESIADAKTRFVSNMSHELRAPMNSIIDLSELALNDESISEQQKDYLQKIKIRSNKLLAVIDDILDIAKTGEEEKALQKVPFDLHVLLNECEAVTAQEADKKGLRLYFYNETKLSHKIIGDPAKLRQALLVFLSNAVKFTERGSITLVAKPDSESESDGEINIIFEISDTGIGMTEETLGQIFEPFHRADSSSAHTFESVGLGLCIAKNIIETMGGDIDARSILNIGSRFSFSLKFALSNEKSMPENRDAFVVFQSAAAHRNNVRNEDNAAIDAVVGIENFAGSKPTYLQALDTFSKRYVETPEILEKAARDKNFTLAQGTAHTEKGAAAIIGAHMLSERLAVLEEAFRRDGLYFKDSMMDEYKEEHAKVLLYISELLSIG